MRIFHRSTLVAPVLGCLFFLASNVQAQSARNPISDPAAWSLFADPWSVGQASGSSAIDLILEPASVVRGQSGEPLVTDRPDFTEASSTVGRGVVQVEMGYTFVHNDDDAARETVRSHSTPETLFRIGLTDILELRIDWNYGWEEVSDRDGRTRRNGAEDLGIGVKIDLVEQCGCRPEQAIILELVTPTGGSSFTSDDVQVGVNYLYSWELPNEWSLGGSTGFNTDTDPVEAAPDDDFHIFFQSVTVGIPLSDCLSTYIEYFGLYSDQRADNTNEHFLNGGFAYLITNDAQFDIRVGAGLNDDSDDFFTGTGLSLRF